MSAQIQAGNYTPTHLQCGPVEFSTLACQIEDRIYFTFESKSENENSRFTLRVNNKFVGDFDYRQIREFNTEVADSYEIMPEVSAGYECKNIVQFFVREQIEQC